MGKKIKFMKMEGCGNDYIYIDGAKYPIDNKPEIVRQLSDRHFGIGGDGVIFIQPSTQADFEMEMYNADGSRGEMCGNGIRCVAKFVYDTGMTDKKDLTIESFGKVKRLQLTLDENQKVSSVSVDMGVPILEAEEIPVQTASADGPVVLQPLVQIPLSILGTEYKASCVSMGNPHAVLFFPEEGKSKEEKIRCIEDMKIFEIGPHIEHHKAFPARTNTEFAAVLDRNHIRMRVWERGAGETLACGTGACATVVAAILQNLTERKVTMHLTGGDLQIEWKKEDGHIYMTGPARTVFVGEIDLDSMN